ncbi:MAG: hypothetical protein RL398_2682 [Planctomycetota bacterium]
MPRPIWILVLLGCALRLHGLGVHSLWYDEAATLHVALADDLVATLLGDRHPPLSHLAFRAWSAWSEPTDVALRLLPALLSCATLAMAARTWCDTRRPAVAAFAVALLACSPFSIWYAQEVRMYAFVEFGAVAGLLGIHRLDQGKRAVGMGWIALGCSVALGSHYFGGCVAIQVAVLAMLRGPRSAVAVRAVAATILGCLPWLPWLVSAVPQQLNTPWGFQARMGLGDLVQLPVRMLVIQGAALPSALVWAVAGCVGIGLLAALHRARSAAATRDALTAFATPIAAAGLVAMVLPPNFAPNYLIAAAPALSIALADGLTGTHRTARLAWALPVLLLTAALLLRTDNLKEDYRSACAEVASAWSPGDVVVAVSGTPEGFSQAPLRHYLRGTSAAAAIVAPDEAAAKLRDPAFDGRVHVVWRAAEYAKPQFDGLLALAELVAKGPTRYRIQSLVLRPRR